MALSARPIPNKSSTGFPAKVCLLNTGGGWRKEIAYCHAEDFSKNCNSLVSDRGTPRFNIGDDVASHVAPKQLYFGGEHVLCPTGSMPKFDHVLSNDVCIFEHTFQKIRVAKNLFL